MMTKIYFTQLGGGLKQTRESREISQATLSEASGISVRMIQNYEQGRNDLNGAKLSTLLKICNALDCDLSAIITDPETLDLLDKYEDR